MGGAAGRGSVWETVGVNEGAGSVEGALDRPGAVGAVGQEQPTPVLEEHRWITERADQHNK